MKTVELFCGTKSFSKVAKSRGHDTFTVDNDEQFEPDLCEDITKIVKLSNNLDVIWASPPCESFSVAAIGKNWDKETKQPKTKKAIESLKLLDDTVFIIKNSETKYWFIENPRGMMRKKIDEIFSKYQITGYVRRTVTYCKYGDNRMKPTDIWTNCKQWIPKPPCKNGAPCHVAAPRGSKTGTQGLKNAKLRGVIPPELFHEIFDSIQNL